MEVVLYAQHDGFVLGDALHFVGPFPGDLDCGLDGFGARVHGEDHVEVEVFGYEFGKAGEDIVVEGSGGESQAGCLVT